MGTADGFFPVVCRWWEPTVELLEASGLPWPEESAMIDLRWWEDYARMKSREGVRFPGQRELARRWKWSRRQVRNLVDRRLEWADPENRGEGGPVADHQRTTSGPPNNGANVHINHKRTTSGPPPDHQRTTLTTLRHRGTRAPHAAGRAPAREDPPGLPLEVQEEAPELDASPRWVKLWTKSQSKPLRGATPLEVFGGLNRALEDIRGKMRTPSESASRPILRLWREALEVEAAHNLDDLVELVVLIGRACRECQDPIFRNDVRGLRDDGTSWKKDTSRTVSAVCRLAAKVNSNGSNWEERLAAAQAWRDNGFPLAAPNKPRTPRRGAPKSAAERLFEELERSQ